MYWDFISWNIYKHTPKSINYTKDFNKSTRNLSGFYKLEYLYINILQNIALAENIYSAIVSKHAGACMSDHK